MKKLFLLILILMSNASFAAENVPVSRNWEPAGFGGGGTYPGAIFDNQIANTLYLTSDVAGIFQSKTGAEEWEFVNQNITSVVNSSLAQSSSNPNVIYALGERFMRSSNRTGSWSNIGTFKGTRPKIYKSIAIDRNDENIVYFATDNGKIYRTLNGGATTPTEYATPFGTNIPAEFLYLNEDGTRLVAGSNGYGMVSYDLTTGTPTDIDFIDTNGLYNNDFGTYDNSGTEVFCVTAGLHIKCTEDFSTWDDTADVTGDTTYYLRRMAVKKLSGGSISFLAWGRKISSQYTNFTSLSTNDGASWVDVSTNVTMDVINNPTEEWASFGAIGTVFSIAFSPHNDTDVVVTTDWRILWSSDGGLNFTEKVKGAQNTVGSDLACSPRMSDGTTRCFSANMDVGLLYTDDVGANWEAVFPNTSNGGPQGFAVAGHTWAVVAMGTQAEWDSGDGQVFATVDYWTDGIQRGIYSNDNGESFTIITSGLPTTKLNSSGTKHTAAWGWGIARALAKCPANDEILALGIDGYSATENGGIYISTNGGQSWNKTPTQPDQWKTYNGIAFDPTDATCNTIEFVEFFYSSPDLPKTWRTTDRGVSSWVAVENDIGVFDLAFGSDGTAYKVGLDQNPMIDLADDGINWSLMKRLNPTSQIADGLLVTDDEIFVGVNDGILISSGQGGETSGTGGSGGSVYMTADKENGTTAIWYNITGSLPSPAGVTAIEKVYDYNGHDWLLVNTHGAGVHRLMLDDTVPIEIVGMSFP